jgi:propionate catabolism operon transcriptional regulator
MACDFAQQAGMESVFLYSLGAVEEAFERSVELARVSRQKESKRVRLNTIVAHLRDGVAAFDEAGQLEAVNPAMLELLGLDAPKEVPLGDREQDIPAQVARAVGPLLRETLANDLPIVERIEQIGGRALIVNCVPIIEQGVRSGSVVTVQDALVAQRIDHSLRTSQRPKHLVARHQLDDLIGGSPALARVRRLARAGAAHDATVLLTGESGTGKELFAQAIHNGGSRSNEPFVAVNCGALPRDLVQSELFGYVDGAFTGSRRGGSAGKFELADGGTLLLDEIGEMPLDAQTSLLRVLQEGEVLRIGAAHPVKVNVRIIAATHCDLVQAVEKGAFRRDLYYRLNVLSIPVPPLRERREDIAGLINGFIHKLSTRMKKIPPQVSPHAMAYLNAWHWPGNVRELENLVERMVNLCEGLLIDVADLPEDITRISPEPDASPSSRLEDNERAHIIQVIESSGGNLRQAARLLGLSRTTLYNKINKWRIDLSLLRT